MKNSSILTGVAAAMLTLFISHSAYAQQFKDLVRGIPSSANVLVIANAKAILNSPVAGAEKWKESHRQLYAYGQTSIPPNTDLMLVGSELDFEFVEPRWAVAMLQMADQPDLAEIARNHSGGQFETVAGHQAVALASDAYLVHFGDRIFGSMSPADRQSVSRWIRKAEAAKGPSLSPYLEEAYHYVNDEGTHAVLAMDLQDAVSIADVKERIAKSKGDYLDILTPRQKDEAAKALASIRGVMLGVNFSSDQTGTVIVDFSEDISILKDLAKPMLLKVLQDYGAYVEEFRSWTVKVDLEQKRVFLRGKLETSGRRRIMSLIPIPAAPSNAYQIAAETSNNVEEGTPEGYASKSYSKAIISYVDQLRLDNNKAKTLGQVAMWLEKYARKIDRLPRSNVDDFSQEWGGDVAELLREAAMSYKGIGIKGRVAELETARDTSPDYAYGSYRYGRYGRYGYQYAFGYNGNAAQRQRLAAVGKIRGEGARDAQEIVQAINNMEKVIRKHIAKTYQLEL